MRCRGRGPTRTVLVGLRFERSACGTLRITGGTVIDPLPGMGIRPMLRAEMRPTYVAAVQVMGAYQRVRRWMGFQRLGECPARRAFRLLGPSFLSSRIRSHRFAGKTIGHLSGRP